MFVQISSLDSHFLWFQKTEQNLHTPTFQKKKLLHDPLLLSCFTLNTFFFPLSFLQFIIVNSFVKTCYSFLFISCFFFSVFLFFLVFSLVCSLFCCLHTFCEHRFFRIAFFQVCLFLVFSAPCFDLSFFWEIIIVVSVLLSPFFWSSFSFIIFPFLPLNFSLFFIPFVCFSIVVSSILTTFQITIFCFFVSFSFSFFFLRVFFILFVCLSYFFLLCGFLFFFSVLFFSLLFITLILLLLHLDLFFFFVRHHSLWFVLSFCLLPFLSLSLFLCFSLCFSPWFVSSLLDVSLFVFFSSPFLHFLLCALCFIFLEGTFCLVPFVLPFGCDGFRSFCSVNFGISSFSCLFHFFEQRKPSFWKVLHFFAIPFLSIFEKKRMPWFSKMFWKFEFCFTSPFCVKFLYHLFFISLTFEKISPLFFFWTLFLVNFLFFSVSSFFLSSSFHSRFWFLFWWIFHFVLFLFWKISFSPAFSRKLFFLCSPSCVLLRKVYLRKISTF